MNAEDSKQGVQAILEAGKHAVTADERCANVVVDYRGTQVSVPIAASAAGGVGVIRDAYDLAVAEHARANPERAGRYAMADLDSLLEWAGRYKTEDTAAFLLAPYAGGSGQIQVIIDELPKTGAGCHRQLSASLALRFSEQLTTWLHLNGQWQTAETFHEFIDQHTDELTTADVLTMAKNIQIKSESSFKRIVADDGKVKLVLEDQSGPSMAVPRKFGFLAPMFDFGEEHKVSTFTARLALKLEKGRPSFRYEIVDLPGRVGDAMRALRDRVVAVVPTAYMRG